MRSSSSGNKYSENESGATPTRRSMVANIASLKSSSSCQPHRRITDRCVPTIQSRGLTVSPVGVVGATRRPNKSVRLMGHTNPNINSIDLHPERWTWSPWTDSRIDPRTWAPTGSHNRTDWIRSQALKEDCGERPNRQSATLRRKLKTNSLTSFCQQKHAINETQTRILK